MHHHSIIARTEKYYIGCVSSKPLTQPIQYNFGSVLACYNFLSVILSFAKDVLFFETIPKMNKYARPLPARQLDAFLKRLLLGIFTAVILVGCSAPRATFAVDLKTQAPPGNATPWPDPDWTTSSPKQQGMDSALLEQMQEKIREQKIGLHSLLIIRHGVIVSETYYAGYRSDQQHELYSVTKSFISTLVGIAIDQGKLRGVDQRVMDLLPNQTGFAGDAAEETVPLNRR